MTTTIVCYTIVAYTDERMPEYSLICSHSKTSLSIGSNQCLIDNNSMITIIVCSMGIISPCQDT